MKNKISHLNNWENHEFSLGTTRLTSINRVLVKGRGVSVEVAVKAFTDRVGYSDMGHNYVAISTNYRVSLPVLGKKVAFTLSKLIADGFSVYFIK